MEERLFDVLKNARKPLSFDKLCEKLEINNENEKKELDKLLDKFTNNYSIVKTSKNNYVLLEKTSFRKGRFLNSRKGFGKVIVKNKYERDGEEFTKTIIYDVLDDDINGAIDGDLVFVNLYSKQKNGPVTADIQKVINRKLESIVGEVYCYSNEYYVKPLDKKKRNLNIKLDNYEVEGTKVSVDLYKQISDTNYIGKVTRRFNHMYDPKEDVLLEAFKCGISDEFSKDTIDEVKSIPCEVRDIDKIGREDFTNMEIFTIDGSDTKDIDDALSCSVLENGNYLIGVHIADVSNYVKSNSSIDIDAYKRGTSVYLPGSVIPMLPRELSNGICSLFPGVERLAISCMMEVTPQGKVVHHDIKKSVIKSNMKMTYDEVNNILNGREYDPLYEEYSDTIKNLNKLALVLRKNRIKRGALSFDRPVVKVNFDDNGNVVGVCNRYCDVGENLIEEFMVLANETVDKHLVDRGYNPLHRVHGEPIADKMESFFRLLNNIGCNFDKYSYMDCCMYPEYMQELEKHIRFTGRLSSILPLNLIRCMSKAKYSPNNIGHYGLASDYYCHFTSPIRRYPDLVIHRLLKLDMDNNFDKDIKPNLEEIGMQTSKMERLAQDAEDEALKLKIAEYMENYVGEEFNGTVIGIDDSGLSVQLDNYIEGRVKIKDLNGRYSADTDNFVLMSLDGKDNYSIGDYLKLELCHASKKDKSINFKCLDKIESINNKIYTKKNN